MRWDYIEINNFMSIRNAVLNFEKQGLVLVEGQNHTSEAFAANGVGKTTALVDSVLYALFDTTSKGIKADDVINRQVGKNTVVTLTGYKGEDQYRIERYRKHTKHKNKVLLFRNNIEITEKSTADTNKAIEKIIGTDFNTFVNSIFFAQGSGVGGFANASDTERKKLLENLINLEIYGKAQDIAKDRVKRKQEEINQKQIEGQRLEWELAQVDLLEQQSFTAYDDTKNLIKQEQDTLGETIHAMSDYTQQTFATVLIAEKEIERLKQVRDQMANIDLSAYIEKCNEAHKLIGDNMNQQNNLVYRKDELIKKYKQLGLDTHCPICGNELDTAHREAEMETIKNELKNILMELQTVQSQQRIYEENYNKANDEFYKVKRLHDNTNTRYRDLTIAIREEERIVQDYNNQLNEYKHDIQACKNTLEKLRNIPEPLPREEERQSIREKIKAHKDALLALEREKQQIEDVVKVYSNSGVKSHVLDLITPYLNKQANKYLSLLSGSEIELTFSTQTRNKSGELSEKFDIQISNRTGGDLYKANSGGERKRIDLAISLALQDLVMSRSESTTNFVVYDEVFDALDSVGSENVIILLKERLATVNSIFVITHNETLRNLFEKVITVVKLKDGESTIHERGDTP
jgi:DNA repair exonuclease SbcCD ATPase subunit